MLAGEWLGVVGCVAPDIVWAGNEIKIRRRGVDLVRNTIERFSDNELLPYRIFHSVLLWVLLFICGVPPMFCLGAMVHIGLDLFTHSGRLNPMPFFPVRWTVWKR